MENDHEKGEKESVQLIALGFGFGEVAQTHVVRRGRQHPYRRPAPILTRQSGGAHLSRLITGKGNPAEGRIANRKALIGTGMDLIVLARQFQYALARLPRPTVRLRAAGVTNACLLAPLFDEITKARRRRVGWQAIATELARAGVHKLSGAPFTAADLRLHINRKLEEDQAQSVVSTSKRRP